MISAGAHRTHAVRAAATLAFAASALVVGTALPSQAASEDRVVTYLGHSFTVPAAWPVINLSSAPTTCVRFDQSAVYLGVPGANQNCPSDVMGHADALLVRPAVAGAVTGASLDAVAHQITSTGGGITATATYASAPAQMLGTIAGGGLPTPSASASTTVPNASAKAKSLAVAPNAVRVNTAPTSAVNYTGEAFDACSAPSASTMSAWKAGSPYSALGIYIGGENRGCSQPNLTASWVSAEAAAGWHFFLVYVGPQAPGSSCTKCGMISSPAADAVSSAQDAVAQAQSLGFGPGAPIVFDMEAYPSTSTSTVLAFMASWTNQLHSEGYASGVYGSMGSMIHDLVAKYGTATMPDVIDFADWNSSPTTSDSAIPSGEWTGSRRIHQYNGGANETYGGVEINVDQDYMDIEGYTSPVSTSAPTGTHQASRAVAQNTGTVDAMWQSTTAQVSHFWYVAGQGWRGPQNLGGSTASEPTTVTTTAGNVTTLWAAPGGILWSTWFAPGSSWAAPYKVGYTGLQSAPYAVGQANGDIDVFWVGSGGALWYGQYTAGAGWGAATDLGGSIASGTVPAPVVSSPGTTAVFFQGTDGTLWSTSSSDYGTTWAAPASLGYTSLGSSPTATGHSNGDIDVFWVCGTADNICSAQYTYPAGWSASAANLGGTVAAGTLPAPVTAADPTTDVFFQGPSGNLWHVYSNDYGTTWATPSDLGMGVITQPTAAAQADGVVDVFWKGSNNAGIWHDFYIPRSGWAMSAQSLGGSVQ